MTPSTRKRIPERTCVVCRKKYNKRDLTRIVRSDTGVLVDVTGKMDGRGAYVCKKDDCWDRVMTSAVLEQALRTSLNDDDRQRILRVKP